MTVLQGIILGIVQGISEFLPISSSGHLALFQRLFGIESEENLTFSIILHIGTLIPVLIVYRETLFELIKKPFQKLTYLIVVATIPTVVVAVLFKDFIEGLANNIAFLGCGFMVTGILLLVSDRLSEGEKAVEDLSVGEEISVSYKDALIIGTMQSIAITPSISRSGSTIIGALFCGLTRKSAAKFSFLMSIPAICGAALLMVLDFVKGDVLIENIPVVPSVCGFFAAAISGYLAIKFMLELIKKCKLQYFAYYLIALSIFILVDTFVLHIYL